MFPVGPSGHTWTAHAKSASWLLHPSRCLRENRTARRWAFLCGCCLRGPVLRGAAVTQRRGFSCGVVCFLHLDFQALGRSVCAVLGASAVFFAADIRLALRHLPAALSRCTGASPCGEADVNGMSPSLCPPAIESFHARLSVGALLASLGMCPPWRASAAAAAWGCLSASWSRPGARPSCRSNPALPPPPPITARPCGQSGSVRLSKGAEPAGRAHREKDVLQGSGCLVTEAG